MISSTSVVFSVMSLVVLVLAIYLGFLLSELKKQKKHKEKIQSELDSRRRKRDAGIYESLRIISLATIQDQCEVSEACIRIYKLLSLLDNFSFKPEYEIFNEMYDELKDFAYLEKRDQLSKQERFEQDGKRFAIENNHRDAFLESCKVLHEHVNALTLQ